jgi:hypothetical protein
MFEEGHTVCPSHPCRTLLMPETVKANLNRFRGRARSFATADAD